MAVVSNMNVSVKLTTVLPMAWRHHCGTLNDGAWPTTNRDSICSGCRCEVRPHEDEVEARYLLVEAT